MADLYKRLESHHEIPPNLEETRVSLERLLENGDQDEDEVISLEEDGPEQASQTESETSDKRENNGEPNSLHLNGALTKPLSDSSTSETKLVEPVKSGSSALDMLMELSNGSGVFYDKDGAINTAL